MAARRSGHSEAPGSRPRHPSVRADRHHIGEDRRAAPRLQPAAPLRVLALTLVVLVVTWVLLAAATVMDRPILTDLDWSMLASLLNTAAVCLAGVVAFLAFVRGRLAGTTNPIFLGTAVLFLGVFAVAIAQLLPQLTATTDETAFVEGLEPSARLVAAVALLAAAVTARVDTRVTPLRAIGAALAATILSAGGLGLVEPAGAAMTSRLGHLGIGFAWVGVAIAHLVVGRRRGSRSHLAVAAAAAVLVLAGLTRMLEPAVLPTTAAIATLFELFALLILLAQGMRDFEQAFCQQRARLLETEVAVETVNTVRRIEREALEERVHDAKSALLAIEAAATVLERHRDQLDAGARGELGEAVTTEVARLHGLIAADGQDGADAPYSLAEVLAPLVTTERARGTRMDLAVPGDLVASGRWTATAEVFRNLFDNARRYASGSPVGITGAVDGDWVLVHVDDRGPGVERTERETIFGRGDRGSSSVGTDGGGLGLYVSRRLVQEQGGDLWVEPRPGGGARFAFCLPLGTGHQDPPDDAAQTIAPSPARLHSGGSDG